MEQDTAAEWTADDFIGGHAALDFTNTAGGRGKVREVERLTDYHTLLRWSVMASLINDEEARSLQNAARSQEGMATNVTARLRAFREALHATLMALQAGDAMPDTDRQYLEDEVRNALANAKLSRHGVSLRWESARPATDLNLPFDRIRLAAQDLLISPEISRVRNCERCSWLFIDRGRGKRRRWCNMATCGNRAKAARFYARHN